MNVLQILVAIFRVPNFNFIHFLTNQCKKCPYAMHVLVLFIIGCALAITEFLYMKSIPFVPGSVVGIATAYVLDGPGIESRWRARFSARPDRP